MVALPYLNVPRETWQALTKADPGTSHRTTRGRVLILSLPVTRVARSLKCADAHHSCSAKEIAPRWGWLGGSKP